jgi:hypothetical protein
MIVSRLLTHAAAVLFWGALALAPPPLAAQNAERCAEPDGRVRATMTLAALSAPERRLATERFGADFAEARATGRMPEDLFAFARCELNDVAPPELIALGRGPTHCTGGPAPVCGLWVLSRTDEGWIEVLETVGTPVLAASTSAGWIDIVTTDGRRPLVYKFGGGAYLTDPGDDALALDPLDAYEAGMDGALQVIWFSVRDDMPPDAEAIFSWFWRNVVQQDGAMTALPEDFRIGLAPIVPDAAPAVVITGLSSQFCDVAGCAHWLYRTAAPGARPELLARFTAADLAVAASGAFGHRDLLVSARGGVQVWRHDGGAYGMSMIARPLGPIEAAAD